MGSAAECATQWRDLKSRHDSHFISSRAVARPPPLLHLRQRAWPLHLHARRKPVASLPRASTARRRTDTNCTAVGGAVIQRPGRLGGGQHGDPATERQAAHRPGDQATGGAWAQPVSVFFFYLFCCICSGGHPARHWCRSDF